jgi:FkbM family methyltransferase
VAAAFDARGLDDDGDAGRSLRVAARVAERPMTMRTGRAERFRRSPWPDRAVARLFGRRQRAAPAPLRLAYEALLDRWPGDRLTAQLPGGERVRVSARHRYLSWNPEEYAAFRAATRPGELVLDVGANVGAYTLLFAQWVGPTGRVVAFEPAAEAAAALRAHLVLNGVDGRVEVSEAAIADRQGTARFSGRAAAGGNAIVPDGTPGSVDVQTTTLDAFCHGRQLQPAVIKVDVEGAELHVLRGAREACADPGVRVFVEFHPSAWPSFGVTPDDLREEFAAQRRTPIALAPDLDIWQTEGVAVRLDPC